MYALFLVACVSLLSPAGCTYHPLHLAPFDAPPPAGGAVTIRLSTAQAHVGLVVAWSGEFLREEDVHESSGVEAMADSRDAADTAALEQISFPQTEELRAGWWEFRITGSVGDADVFVPIICRQKIFSGENVELNAREGSLDCTAVKGIEPPKTFVWGERPGTSPVFVNGVDASRSEAFPDLAEASGPMNLLFLLVKQDTVPGDVNEVKVAFYAESGGRPGARIGPSFAVPLEQLLADRGRVDTPTTPLKGDTWVWFEVPEGVPVQQGQIVYISVLAPCPPAPAPCVTTARILHLYSLNTDAAGQNIASPNVNETDLPSPWPAGGTVYPNSAPLMAFGLSRP